MPRAPRGSRPRTTNVVLNTPRLGVDASDFKKFATEIRRASKELGRELNSKVKSAAELVASDARERAAEHSEKIAATVRARATGGAVAFVEAGGGEVDAIAELEELGNRNNPTRHGMAPRPNDKFRHPVFGNKDKWVEQPMHPYLEPAARARTEAALELIGKAVDDALSHVGLEMH